MYSIDANIFIYAAIIGKLVSDAIIASQLEAAGVRTIYTNDRDFNKFPALKPKNPFTSRK